MIATLTLPSEASDTGGGLVNCYPYAPTSALTTNWLYEPLMIRNNFSCDVIPGLATAPEASMRRRSPATSR